MKWIKFLILVSFLTLLPANSFAQTDPRQFDVAGIKLGMTADEVKKILKAMPGGGWIEGGGSTTENMASSVQTMEFCVSQFVEKINMMERTGSFMEPKPACYGSLSYSYSAGPVNRRISIFVLFTEDFQKRPGTSVVWQVQFSQEHDDWKGIQQRLLQKYGNPTFCYGYAPKQCSFELRNERFVWVPAGSNITSQIGISTISDRFRVLQASEGGHSREVSITLSDAPFLNANGQARTKYLDSVTRNARPQSKPVF
jgi:hypothetical protein